MPETKSNAKQCANRTWWESKYPDKYNENNSNYYYPDPPSLFNLGNFGSKPRQYKGDFKGKCNHTRHYREDRSPSIVVSRSRLRDSAPTDYSRLALKSSLRRRHDSRRSHHSYSRRSPSHRYSRRSPEHQVGFVEELPRSPLHPRASGSQKPFANVRSSVELREQRASVSQKPFANVRSSVELREQRASVSQKRSSVDLPARASVKFEAPSVRFEN